MQAAAVTLPSSPNGNDFADWLSPILVKELRQGLKSRAFVVTFIIVQVVMILLVGMQLLTLAGGGGGRGTMEGFDWFFWLFVAVPLLVMMPARGLIAVSDEVRANTLDLVQLTRLTAFRIVLGKWVALVSQTLLLVAAILPYAVLRYFFGDVDVVADLRSIGMRLLSSVCLTAAAIALSSVHIAVRIILLVLLLPALFTINMIVEDMASASTAGVAIGWGWMAMLFVAAYTYLMLEIAAARIAPISENHAAPKRMLSLFLAGAGVLVAIFADEKTTDLWIGASALACGWVVLEALCERTVDVPSLYGPFARRGFLGRLAGRILYPGWASGLLFFALLTGLLTTAAFIEMHIHHPGTWNDDAGKVALMIEIAFAAVISPVVVLIFFPRVRQPMWLYVLVQAICALLFLIAFIAEGNASMLNPGDAYRWLAPFPTSALFALFNSMSNAGLRDFFAMVSLPVCALLAGYLGFRVLREFRMISQYERECLARKPTLQTDSPSA